MSEEQPDITGPEEDPVLKMEFKLSEVNALISFLAKLPYGDVADAIHHLRDRGIRAVKAFNEEKARKEL